MQGLEWVREEVLEIISVFLYLPQMGSRENCALFSPALLYEEYLPLVLPPMSRKGGLGLRHALVRGATTGSSLKLIFPSSRPEEEFNEEFLLLFHLATICVATRGV